MSDPKVHNIFSASLGHIQQPMKYALSFCLICFTWLLSAQDYISFDKRYQSWSSQSARDSFALDIHVPHVTAYGSEDLSFPLIILLDNQNEYTHRHNLSSIDILTMHDQIPASVVVGVGFRWDNRMHLTSAEVRKGDDLSGLEKSAQFLFNELVPECRKMYNATGPVLILGHSRTAFLTSYLMTRHFDEFHAAGSFSGFVENGVSAEAILTAASEIESLKQPFSWYFTAGSNNPEEATYLKDYRDINDQLGQLNSLQYYKPQFAEHPAAGHMANYNLSVPEMMVQYFAPYSSILNDWLFIKLDEWSNENEDVAKASPAKALEADLEQAGKKMNAPLVPQPVQVISMANYFYNNEHFEWALDMLLLGMDYYPGDYDINYLTCITYLKLGKQSQAEELKKNNLERIKLDTNLNSSEKQGYISDFEEIDI